MADAEWEKDLQFTSMFLDRKEEIKGENERYLEAHPAVRQVTSDFLSHLLHRKPDDPVAEAKEFFKQFNSNVGAGVAK